MINKRTFPNLVLALVSLGAIILSLAFFWFSFGAPYFAFEARFGRPAPNQSAPNFFGLFMWGICSGLALTMLIWIGAGVDRLLAHIKKPLISLGVYLIAPGALCICLPASIILLLDVSYPGPKTGGEQHFLRGFLTVVAFLPVIFGFTSIYIGAGISALSRWLAGRIWREPLGAQQEEKILG